MTWFGLSTDEADIALNTDFAWATGGANNFDVETVLLHENGHLAGLGHSPKWKAVLYASYLGVHPALDRDDINGIKFLYPAASETGGGGDLGAFCDRHSDHRRCL